MTILNVGNEDQEANFTIEDSDVETQSQAESHFSEEPQQLNDSDLPVTHVGANQGKRLLWKKIIIGVALVAMIVAISVAATQGGKSSTSNSDNQAQSEQEPFEKEEQGVETILDHTIEFTNGHGPRPIEETIRPPRHEHTGALFDSYNSTEPLEGESTSSTTGHDAFIVATQNICPASTITAASGRNAGNGGDDKNETTTSSSSSKAPQWIQIAADIVGEAARDSSGTSLDMSADGRIVAIGSMMNDAVNKSRAGHVRVYELDPSTGEFLQMGHDIDGQDERDWFGSSLSLDASGYRVAAGAMFADSKDASKTGHVRVFDYQQSNDEWVQVGHTIHGQEGDQLGASVSLSADGRVIAVGATHADADHGTDVGVVYVYELVEGVWESIGIIHGEGVEDMAGATIALSSDGFHLAIGASLHDDDKSEATDVGQVRVYRYTGHHEWTQVGDDISSTRSNQQTGFSLSILDHGLVAIGFPEISNGFPHPGVTRIFWFEPVTATWVQVGNDLVGSDFVSISQTKRVAVGDHSNYQNGMDSGTVRVYDFDEDRQVWYLVGQEIHGNEFEMLGIAAVLSADGSRVAVSSPGHGSGENKHVGATRVYDLC